MITTSSNTEVKYSRTKTTCDQNHIPEILSKSLTEAVIGRGATECTAVQSEGVTSAQILAIHRITSDNGRLAVFDHQESDLIPKQNFPLKELDGEPKD